MQNKIQTNTRVRSLTGWRGLAVLAVILFHWFPQKIAGGYLGVVIFFVLSGYLVTEKFLQNIQTDGHLDWLNFYKRRIWRLYPPMLFFILLLTTWVIFFQPDMLYTYRAGLFSTLFGVNNWWQISNGLAYFEQFSLPNLFKHMWAFAVEIQLYLFWPFVIILIHKAKPRKLYRYVAYLCIALIAFSSLCLTVRFVNSGLTRAYYGTDSRLFSFFFGALLATGFSRQRLYILGTKVNNNVKLVSIALLVLFMVMLLVMPGDRIFTYIIGMLFFTLLFVVLMALSMMKGFYLNTIFSNPVFVWLGERSYSIYLWQYPLMTLTNQAFKGTEMSMGASVCLQILFLIILTELTYQIVERDSFNMKSFFKVDSFYKNPKKNWKSILVLIVLCFLTISTLTALIKAPSGLPADIAEMKARIEAQQQDQKLDQSKIKSKDKQKTAGTKDQTKDNKSDAISEGSGTVATEKVEQFDAVTRMYPELTITPEEAKIAKDLPITAIGDSVLAMGAIELKQLLPQIVSDAGVSRQFPAGLDLLNDLDKSSTLKPNILFALGSNGVINAGMIDDLATTYANKDIFLLTIVTNTEWEGDVNQLIHVAATKHKNIHVIDWHGFAKSKRDLFYEDGTHPNPDGAPVYAQFVAKQILSFKSKKSSN